MENHHKILCFLEHTDHKIWESAKSLNNKKSWKRPKIGRFSFLGQQKDNQNQ